MSDLDLSRRAIAAGWRWEAGARYITDAWNRDGFDRVPDRPELAAFQAWVGALPDFNDAPTRGALLEQVRTDWDDIGLHAVGLYRDGAWHWRVRGGKHHGGTFNRATEKWHDSETAALVAALEAAPKEKGL